MTHHIDAHPTPHNDRESIVWPVLSVVGVVIVAVMILSAVTALISGVIGLLIPGALIAGGITLMNRDHRVIGVALAAIGGLVLLSNLGTLLVVAVVVLVGWLALRD